jgi:sugar phosphate permease
MSGSEAAARRRAWVVTFVAYATYYAGRKGFSVAKKPIERELGIRRSELAAIDTGYLLAYSVGQILSGLLSDRVGARRLIGWGMLVSAAACAMFGFSRTAVLFFVAFTANGFAQSTGWPGTTRAMTEWTTPENRRGVMALWTTCYQFGGIGGTALAAYLLKYGWRAAFFMPALMLAGIGVVVLAMLAPGPTAATEQGPDFDRAAFEADFRAARRNVLRSPVLYSYGASYFGIKLIRYSLLFWLPYYLSDELAYPDGTAGYLSTALEIGGVFGVLGAGLFAARARHLPRSKISAAILVGLAGALLLYTKVAPLGATVNVIALFLVGALLYGPDSLLSGAAAMDAGGPLAAATATGLVNSIGSLGAVLQGALNAWVSQAFGWHAVFVVLIVLAFASAAALIPTFRRPEA